MKKTELLAPAGDLVRMKYAYAYGADAVYAGQPAFSLRARENGFRSLDDLAEGIAYARSLGKKFYLTSNVIPRNVKVESFQKALLAAIELKPDALIVADPGFVGWLRKERPDVEIHLSVQANTTNYLAAKFWRDLGVCRIILSRELRLSEILEIKEKLPDLELEVFVHGAVCMAMSGRCMLSNWVTHRDANQGACDNSCRMPYRLYANSGPQVEDYREHEGEFSLQRTDRPELPPVALDEDTWGTYFMSSRDLCALDVIPELVQGGLDSFKIEGRTRSVYYLSQVVRAYRMPGFLRGPLPQNYEATHVDAEGGCVAAQILDYDATTNSCRVNVKNPFCMDDSLEIMTPAGMDPIQVESLMDFRGAAADRLNPGTEGRVFLQENVLKNTEKANFGFIVKKITAHRASNT